MRTSRSRMSRLFPTTLQIPCSPLARTLTSEPSRPVGAHFSLSFTHIVCILCAASVSACCYRSAPPIPNMLVQQHVATYGYTIFKRFHA